MDLFEQTVQDQYEFENIKSQLMSLKNRKNKNIDFSSVFNKILITFLSILMLFSRPYWSNKELPYNIY